MIIRNPPAGGRRSAAFEEKGLLLPLALYVALDEDFAHGLRIESRVEHNRGSGHGSRGKILHLIHIEAFKRRIAAHPFQILHAAALMN